MASHQMKRRVQRNKTGQSAKRKSKFGLLFDIIVHYTIVLHYRDRLDKEMPKLQEPETPNFQGSNKFALLNDDSD